MKRTISILVALLALALLNPSARAAQVSDVASSKHNLTAYQLDGSGTTTDRVCVFCHTPHGATADGGGGFVTPLWNRDLSTQSYVLYDTLELGGDQQKGSSIDATDLSQPGGTSKLCLSCHDGTVAIGKVNVFNAASTPGDGTTMATGPGAGDGSTTGFTRNLGTSLANDHPISFTYTDALATADGELFSPASDGGSASHINNRVAGSSTPLVPLESDEVQCTTCHDPHVINDTVNDTNKFVRQGLNRFQVAEQSGGSDTTFTEGDDILCLACHTKDGWSASVHAVSTVAYDATAATQRDFPSTIKVWEAACLNCHDTHTVQGARKLLREGVGDATNLTPKTGGKPAQEETCYQCHDGSGSVVSAASAANIEGDFLLARRMPIVQADTPLGADTYEAHSITDKDFTESTTQLGMTAANRHAECTDCHNPHRMMRNALFDGSSSTTSQGTHLHDSGTMHTNEASGVLSGTTGVEPVYGACGTTANWSSCTITSYTELKGSHDNGTTTPVTKEYQVCLKCHSDYAYATPPNLESFNGGTPSGTNNMTQYTNQAFEFQSDDQGESSATHSSFHPVRLATGRDVASRANMSDTNFTAPWNNSAGASIGSQTMYCTDCHGSETVMSTTFGASTSVPTGNNPWGPHGSTKDFILKGEWELDGTQVTGESSANSVSLCFRCHDYDAYSNVNNATATNVVNYKSGFSSAIIGASGAMGCTIDPTVDQNNLHLGHRIRIGKDLRCNWCHVAVPHGWKYKALLVDISQPHVSASSPGCGGLEPCTDAPYYVNAMLGGGGLTFKTSGNWQDTDCGGANGFASWMGGTCNNPP